MSVAKILVIDDEPQIRCVMRATLSANGYEVIDARSGEEALARLRDELPDLVLLDMDLPGMSGVETSRAIRASSEVPIVILSVRNAEADKVQALDAGADDYVTKPFGMAELDRLPMVSYLIELMGRKYISAQDFTVLRRLPQRRLPGALGDYRGKFKPLLPHQTRASLKQ